MRVVFIPGMAANKSSRWYPWFAEEMRKRSGVSEVVLRDFPDQPNCRESIWIPFLINEIGVDHDTVIVGHSTGASCAMRLLESGKASKLRGVILVAAAYTDLGDEFERRSEYFNRPWDWDKMKLGADHIHLFHGTDDPGIPVAEARHIAKMMNGDNFQYDELENKGHFLYKFQEILDVMDKHFGAAGAAS